VQANVYDAVDALGGRRFDVVYTGLGAINWLADIEAWASTMAALLAPGGTFYLAEFHPFSDVFEPGTYADVEAQTTHNRSIEWTHGLGSVISALIAVGLRIELLHEHDYTLFPRWPMLRARGGWNLPLSRRGALAAAHGSLRAAGL
jgi:hypothetical protein